MFYSQFCNNILLPLTDLISQRKIYHYTKFLTRAQWWSHAKLSEYQFESLKRTLIFANLNTPYYRKIFNELNFRPQNITSIEDLKQLPLLTKSIIQSEGIESFIQGGTTNKLIKESTSGSTGKQASFYFSKPAQSFTYAAQLQFFNWAGYSLGDRYLQTGMSFPRGFEKKTKDILYRCEYISAFHLTDKDLEAAVNKLKKKKLEFLLGYASSLYCIGNFLIRQNSSIPLKGVISLGDMLFPHYRDVLERAFQCKVTDTYGSCEGFMVAGQCEHNNYHISMPLNIVEIVDKNGNNVPDGEAGRVILTRLDNNPMPLIRYEIGDMAVLSKKRQCECKRGYPLLEKIMGRDTDIVVTPNGHKLIVHFFTGIFEHEDSIDEFQVLQNEPSEIIISYIPRTNFNEKVIPRVLEKINQKCNGDIKVVFKKVQNIPPSKSGKRRFVISKYSLNG